MLKKHTLFICLLSLLLMVSARDQVTIIVVQTRLCSKPDFLSSTVASLKRGDRLIILKEGEGWVQVKTPRNLTGYIHKTAFTKSNVKLTGLIPGQQGASRNEIALAAKGFNRGNEKVLRSRQGFNFRDLDWIFNWTVSIRVLKNFVKQGKLK